MATGPLDATLKVEAAWGDDWKTASPTWVDVTSYVRSLDCSRGRRHELSQYLAGRMNLTLDNSDRRFEPEYASGAYYPDIKPGVPIRLTAAYGNNLLSDPYATVVDATVESGASDHFDGVNITACVRSDTDTIGKYPTVKATSNGAAILAIDAGSELDDISVSGSTEYTISVYIVSSVTLREARVQATDYDASDVEGDTTTGSFTEDISTSLASPTRISVTHTTASDADHLRIRVNMQKNAGTAPDSGDIAYISKLQLETGASATPWAPSGQRPLWQGFTERFSLTYPSAASDAVVTLSCIDGFKYFAQAEAESYRQVVLEDNPIAYWIMDEPTGEVLEDSSGNGRTAAFIDQTALPDYQQTGAFTGGYSIDANDTTAKGALVAGVEALQIVGDLTFECWINDDANDWTSAGQNRVIAGAASGSPYQDGAWTVRVEDAASSDGEMTFTHGDGTNGYSAVASDFFDTGAVFRHLVVTRDVSAQTVEIWRDGVSQTVSAGTWRTPVTGASHVAGVFGYGGTSYAPSTSGWPYKLAHVAIYDRVLSDEAIKRHAAAAEDARVSQSTGTFLGVLLDDLGWPSGARSIDTGAVTVDAGPYPSGSFIGVMRQVERTEDGFLYMGADGDVVFKDRTSRDDHSATVAYTFGPSDLDHQEAGFAAFYDDSLIFNQIRIEGREHGSVVVNDATSQTDYGIRTLTYSGIFLPQRKMWTGLPRPIARTYSNVLTETGATIDALADAIITRTKDPHLRVPSFTVQPQGDPTNLWPAVLTLDIGDRVTVEVDPPGGGANLSEDLFIEGITHTITPGQWLTTYDTGPALASGY